MIDVLAKRLVIWSSARRQQETSNIVRTANLSTARGERINVCPFYISKDNINTYVYNLRSYTKSWLESSAKLLFREMRIIFTYRIHDFDVNYSNSFDERMR